MIRNSDINDLDNAEILRDVWIIVVILYQFPIRIIPVIEGFSLLFSLFGPQIPSSNLALVMPKSDPYPAPERLTSELWVLEGARRPRLAEVQVAQGRPREGKGCRTLWGRCSTGTLVYYYLGLVGVLVGLSSIALKLWVFVNTVT
jgi:hypothetical protein